MPQTLNSQPKLEPLKEIAHVLCYMCRGKSNFATRCQTAGFGFTSGGLVLKLPLHCWTPGGLPPYVATSFGGDIGFMSLP